jgi:protein-S-isoprenylcysteine O-methyltransferase Ste14
MVRNMDQQPEMIIDHPNREKAESKATKAIVVLLILVSVGLIAIVTIGGWDALEGAKMLQIVYALIYLVIAYYIARWNRGLLPVISAAAIVLLIFAAVAGPAWFDRDKSGFTDPALPSEILGLVTLIIIPVQALLIAFAMRGFGQGWNVEVERQVGAPPPPSSASPAPAAG